MKLALLLAATAVAHVLLLALVPFSPRSLDWLCLETVRPVLLNGPSVLAAKTALPVGQILATLWVLALLLSLFRAVIATCRRREVRAAWRRATVWVLVIVSLTLHAFLLSFGMLYLGLTAEDRMPRLLAEIAAARLEQEAMSFAGSTKASRVLAVPRSLEEISALVVAAENVRLAELGMPALPATLRAKAVWPRGVLLAGGISGMAAFLPPEPLVDSMVDAALLPMLVAHEMAHMAGFAHEDEAEFFAWWTLADHPESDVRYSAWLAIAMRIARGLPLASRSRFNQALGPEVREDMRRVAGKFTENRIAVVAGATATVHETYLKSMGVEEGVASYERAARLVLMELATRP